MKVSPFCRRGLSLAMVSSTGAPAGTIIQIARGACRFLTRPSRVETPTEPASLSRFTASWLKSKPTTLCPPSRRRSAILPPILPRPMIPSSIFAPPDQFRKIRLSRSRSDFQFFLEIILFDFDSQIREAIGQLRRILVADCVNAQRGSRRHVLGTIVDEHHFFRIA